jgi:hypothetical protein
VVTTSQKFLQSAPDGVTVPKNVILEAVNSSPELRQMLNLKTDPSELTFSKIAEVAQGKSVTWKPAEKVITGIFCGTPKEQKMKERSWSDLSCDSSAKYNSEAISQLLVRGGLDTSNDIKTKVDGSSVDLVPVRPGFAYMLMASNEAAVSPKPINVPGRQSLSGRDAKYAMDIADNLENVNSVAFEQKDTVTFGNPLVDSAAHAISSSSNSILAGSGSAQNCIKICSRLSSRGTGPDQKIQISRPACAVLSEIYTIEARAL